MKEQLVSQLKTQIADLERFINYLQGEVSTETLACTCACPVHAGGSGASSASYGSKRRFERGRPVEEETGAANRTRTLNTVRNVVALLHMFLMSQLGCGSERVRRNFGGNSRNPMHNWRDLRTRLDIAVEHVLETIVEISQQHQQLQRHPDDEEEFSTYVRRTRPQKRLQKESRALTFPFTPVFASTPSRVYRTFNAF